MRKFTKIISICSLLLLFLLSGCEKSTSQTIKVMVPKGAPSLAILPSYQEETVEVQNVVGTDLLTAELAKQTSDTDIVIAPVNLGVKMISENKSDYQLQAIITWGNLYVVGNKDASQEEVLLAFGEQSIPGKVVKLLETNRSIDFVKDANDVQAALLAQKYQLGLLAEPAATATIQKAKQAGLNFEILHDLQKEYQEKFNTSSYGYPQAAVFIKKGSEKKVQRLLNQWEAFMNSDCKEEDLRNQLSTLSLEQLGIMNLDIAIKTWKRQNIKYVSIEEVEKELETYLNIINQK